MKKINKLDFRGENIYVGLDIHKNSWQVSIHLKEFEHKTYSQPPDVNILVNYLKRNFPNGNYYSAYEAGFSGFGLHKRLMEMGIRNTIVNPADIPTKDKERKTKTDTIDARKIAVALKRQELTGIYIPEDDNLEDRSLLRLRYGIVKKQTRVKNQIKGFLNFYGIKLEEREDPEIVERYWSKRYIEWLKKISMKYSSGSKVIEILIEELLNIRAMLLKTTKEIRKLSVSEQYKERVQFLLTVPGIGLISAMTILTELIDVNRFQTLDQLNSYAGLLPTESSSGEKERKGKMTTRRNVILRRILIEGAWIAVRKDPSLTSYFNKLLVRMNKNRAITRIARKLLNRIRYVLKNQKPYIIGVIE